MLGFLGTERGARQRPNRSLLRSLPSRHAELAESEVARSLGHRPHGRNSPGGGQAKKLSLEIRTVARLIASVPQTSAKH